MALPFVISIPHCANMVPDELKPTMALDENEIIASVDFGTREIFGRIPAQATITAQWSRLVVDLNRAPDRLDAKGVVALTDYHGRAVFKPQMAPDAHSISQRVAEYHHPYHASLEKMLRENPAVGLIDGHSLNGIGPPDAPDAGQRRKDIILSNNGDTRGRSNPSMGRTSCSPEQIHAFKSAFEQHGFSVSVNTPYQGGYIVNHYGALLRSSNRFAIQIELNQDLYMAPGSQNPEKHRIEQVYSQFLSALESVAASLEAAADIA